jgi:hypothetical protein
MTAQTVAARPRVTARPRTRIKFETIIGAILAFITISAAITRYVLSPGTPTDVLNAVIAVTSPLLTLVILIAAVRSLRALLGKQDLSFAGTLDRELDDWLERMQPLVRPKNEFDGEEDRDGATYEMLVHHDFILKKGENLDGRPHVQFLRLPPSFRSGERVLLYVRESMFTRRAEALDEDRTVVAEKVAKDFAAVIAQTFTDLVAVHAYPDSRQADMITLTLKRDLTTADDAHRLMSLLNYATLLYLAVA